MPHRLTGRPAATRKEPAVMHALTEPVTTEHPEAAGAESGYPAAGGPRRQLIPTADLRTHPGNVRQDLDLSAEFKASVAAEGVRIPLLITAGPEGGWRGV